MLIEHFRDMVTTGSTARVSTAPPPHELNVRKFVESRASELEGLQCIVADRLDNNFRSQRNKRKRTTGHDNRVAKRRFRKKTAVGVEEDLHKRRDSLRKDDDKKISRRVQRRIELTKNLPSGFGTSGDGTKRLRTHVWHAKRFTMTKLWGFHLPLGLHGRGRGSRALLKKLKHGVLLHDASYYGAVQLEGPEARHLLTLYDILVSVLSSVLVPSPSSRCEEISHDILHGDTFGTAMLHHARKHCSAPIAPVTYMWRPQRRIAANTDGLSFDFHNGEQSIDDGNIIRQVWVWIHAAAFREAYDAMVSACDEQMDITRRPAHCVSLEGQLAKLELVGSKVFQLLQKTLHPASCSSENSWHLKKCLTNENSNHGESENTSILENENQISSSAVVSLVLKDPRGLVSNEECEIKQEAECQVGYSDLWDVSKGVLPPVEESVLCMEKHRQHKEFICLGHKSSGSQKNASVDGKYSRVCPVLLLKNQNHEDSVTSRSIILPLSWVKAFWIKFISNGAHAIGLREKHWIAGEIGLPYFPCDFPDCNAYSHVMAMEAVEVNNKARLRPPSKRPLEVPIPPPWNSLILTSEYMSSKGGNSHRQAEELGTQDETIDNKSETFECIIARTSFVLNDFLTNICGNRLLLFPRISGQKNELNNLLKDREFLKQENVLSVVKCGKERCYVRVLLRPFKEGVFEQGAVVCAPRAADILLWKARSEGDDQKLELPQSSLGSYFKQTPSGKWEPQIPEDSALRESYRWPIGFITTGFVRGRQVKTPFFMFFKFIYCKKPMAGAICEASLLSRLREEQWKALPVRQRRKEIYVLVRNMRSTAYRLALSTIVLEQQQLDVNFI
ncbi:hypothetical protein BUALT_Bualt13G0069000 [Buddleja alternifolia]|uniref:Uncharacterized protein n=1 Tax=Buddleja alternifolia TaxID=168488 RepID=A0AAV6WME0_9LAMI|nr:hypothetical protein BUALT_Bualt13G0069000 [Buddleja alternifolia]